MKHLFVFVLLLAGCSGKQASSDKPQEQKAKTEKSFVGRFQPFKNLPGVALDTMSGKLCKTYEPGAAETKTIRYPVNICRNRCAAASAIANRANSN